jgi:hypothetical protein
VVFPSSLCAFGKAPPCLECLPFSYLDQLQVYYRHPFGWDAGMPVALCTILSPDYPVS